MILNVARQWYCPNCTAQFTTHKLISQPILHPCRGLHGIHAPMLAVGVRAKVTAKEREDYIGTETAGRIMSVVTERNDGQDALIFAPLAKGRGEV
jgi:hypothetical protein